MIVDQCANCARAERMALTAAEDVEFLHTVARNMKIHCDLLERDKLEIAAELVALRERFEALTLGHDGREFAHTHGLGDCPACWAEAIRKALEVESDA